MRLGSALPFVLDRHYPVVRPDFPLITVLYLLRMQDLAAVPLTSANDECKAVFGFSSLERLAKMGQRRFASFVQGPCGNASGRLNCFTLDQELAEVLDSFKSRRLGVAAVRGPNSYGRFSLVTLADVLRLYENGLIDTDLVVEDVASPIFSMPAGTSVREALRAMFKHQFRRIFVSRDGCYISDRSIVDYDLGPLGLDSLVYEPRRDPLATPISKLWSVAPVPVGRKTNLREAARKLRERRAECLVMPGDKIVTPWDLVMKPWLSGKLVIADGTEKFATARPSPRRH